MRGSSRPGARKIETGGALARLVAITVVLSRSIMSAAQAQFADADAHSDTHAFTEAADPDGGQLDGVVRRGGDQSRQQFPGAAGQPVEQRLQPPAADQSGRRRRLREHGSAALPDLVRRLRQLYEKRRGRRFRRRHQQRPRAAWPDRRAGGAGHQYRIVRRPEPLGDRYSAGAAIGDDRPDPDRLHGLRRQRAVDLGQRGRARFRQHRFAPRHRLWACDRRIQCAARRRAERDQLLLDQGPEPHRAQGARSNMSARGPARCRRSAASIPRRRRAPPCSAGGY